MKITSNIQDLILKYQRIAAAAVTLDVSAALTIGVNTAKSKMANRIFNEGMDAQLKPLGEYVGNKGKLTSRKFRGTEGVEDADVKKKVKKLQARLKRNADATGNDEFTAYEKERLAHGRQIKYKDLEFTGELRRSYKTVNTGTGVYAAFDNEKNAKIAQYQEEQIGGIRGGGKAIIFALSDDERKLWKDETNAALNQLYAGLFNS